LVPKALRHLRGRVTDGAITSRGCDRYGCPPAAATGAGDGGSCTLSALSVKLFAVISFHQLIGEGGKEGAREKFERLIAQLVRARQPLYRHRIHRGP
jgi:hypothetical protein